MDARNQNPCRAAKHYLIAAKAGDEKSLACVNKYYMKGVVTKDEYEITLRAFQESVNDTVVSP